ncbi:MAG: hypothetical protein IKQ10_03580 [Oscillospiraceae bacterium]|nr:hypothetical protein [Oscillospiraceae bacterium]
MTSIWKWVAVISLLMLAISLALVGVAYFSGSSVQRLLQTTDIADMTKFVSRDQLELYVNALFDLFG